MSQDNNPANVRDLEAIAAVFGPVARVLEPLIDRYRPAIDALTEAVGEVAESVSDEAPDATVVQARVQAAIPLLVSSIKENGVPNSGGLLAVWGATADLVDPDSLSNSDDGTATSQIDGQLDELERADLEACTKALGVVAGLIAPVYQNFRPMYDALSQAVATVLTESDDELPDANELAATIRTVSEEIRPLIQQLKDGEISPQMLLGSGALFVMAVTGGEQSAITAFETGRYNRAEFDRYGQEVADGLPGLAVAQAMIVQVLEAGLGMTTAVEALDFFISESDVEEYQLVNPDALDSPADDDSDDESTDD